MRFSYSALPFLFSLLFLASCSSKPDRPPFPRDMQNGQILKPAGLLFSGFDTDLNYHMSHDEFAFGIERAFLAADQDQSGDLSLWEYQKWAQAALGSATALPGWMGIDRDGNKILEREEFKRAYHRLAEEYGLTKLNELPLASLTVDMDEVLSKIRSGGQRPGGFGGGKGRGRRPADDTV